MGMNINAAKSAACYLIFPNGKITVNNRGTPCVINGNEIPQVSSDGKYRYLGVKMDARGKAMIPETAET